LLKISHGNCGALQRRHVKKEGLAATSHGGSNDKKVCAATTKAITLPTIFCALRFAVKYHIMKKILSDLFLF